MPLENTGKTITSIRYCKDKVVIRFNKEKLDIPHDVFTSFYLFKGKNLSSKEMKEIKSQIEIYDLYRYAKRLCSKSLYSEHKIREKLYQKDASKSEVDEVIVKLKAANLLNDKELVSEYVAYLNERNIGKNKIKMKLLEKGVFPENIDNIDFPESLEKEKALTYLDKLDKRYDKYNYQKKKDHIIHYLVNQGFDLDIVLSIANKIKSPSSKDEYKKLETDFYKAISKYKKEYEGRKLKEKVFNNLQSKGYKLKDIINVWEDKYI